ncbi:MAG: Eco57I restriction-modification methylase domain-containing protein [Bacteroidales bacterium]|nr:Eco57I restriction-modification methylase domain-containing protein [Bacteroidales bacterium]
MDYDRYILLINRSSNQGFDVVIGNPPYVNVANIRDNKYRELLKNTFTISKNKTDFYAFFMEKGFSILAVDGVLSYITPETWKATDSFSKLRDLVMDNHSITTIVNLKMGVFDAIVRPMITIFSNKYKENYKIKVYDGLMTFKYNLEDTEIKNNPTYAIDSESSIEEKYIFCQVEKAKKRLSDIVNFSRGIKTSDDNRFISNEKNGMDYKPVFRGRNIKAYTLNWAGEYIWYRPDLMREKVGCLPHSKEFFEVPEKLVTQRVNSSMQLLVAYDNEQNYFLDTTNVSRYETLNTHYSLKFICGVLNSKTINFWYSRKYRMPTIGGYELDSIPIPAATSDQQQPIIDLVDSILAAKKANPQADTSEDEKEIDRLVYDLYGLTEEEIKIIEGK